LLVKTLLPGLDLILPELPAVLAPRNPALWVLVLLRLRTLRALSMEPQISSS
jgi:hypothetical protein